MVAVWSMSSHHNRRRRGLHLPTSADAVHSLDESGFHFFAPVLSEAAVAEVTVAAAVRSGLFMRSVLNMSRRRAATRVPLWSVLRRMFAKPPAAVWRRQDREPSALGG